MCKRQNRESPSVPSLRLKSSAPSRARVRPAQEDALPAQEGALPAQEDALPSLSSRARTVVVLLRELLRAELVHLDHLVRERARVEEALRVEHDLSDEGVVGDHH
eukprot:1464368-Pleurochrysis_carterae.AAC.1